MFDDFSHEINPDSDKKIDELQRELKAMQEELWEKEKLIEAQTDEIARLKRLLYKTM